jgi:hypothetical protein
MSRAGAKFGLVMSGYGTSWMTAQSTRSGRVEMWRGGGRLNISVSASFV